MGIPMAMAAGYGDEDSDRMIGFRFDPTDEELVTYFLHNKAVAQLPKCYARIIPDFNRLGKTDPWVVWDCLGGPHLAGQQEGQSLYFFTELENYKPNAKRFKRQIKTDSGGTWSQATCMFVQDENGKDIGEKKYFRYENKGSEHHTGWIIDEYSILGVESKIVLCRFRKNPRNSLRIQGEGAAATNQQPNQAGNQGKKRNRTNNEKPATKKARKEFETLSATSPMEPAEQVYSTPTTPSGVEDGSNMINGGENHHQEHSMMMMMMSDPNSIYNAPENNFCVNGQNNIWMPDYAADGQSVNIHDGIDIDAIFETMDESEFLQQMLQPSEVVALMEELEAVIH